MAVTLRGVDMAVTLKGVDMAVTLKGVAMVGTLNGEAMADLVVRSVVVVVVNPTMGKVVMENALLAGHLNAIVELDAGEYCFQHYSHI